MTLLTLASLDMAVYVVLVGYTYGRQEVRRFLAPETIVGWVRICYFCRRVLRAAWALRIRQWFSYRQRLRTVRTVMARARALGSTLVRGQELLGGALTISLERPLPRLHSREQALWETIAREVH